MYANQDIYRKDLRHIYSGLPPPEIRFRVRTYHSGIDHLARLHEMQTRPRTPREPLRSYEYMPQYGISIPRAPAFKRLSKTDVSELVARLHGSKDLDEKKLLEQIEPKGKTTDKDAGIPTPRPRRAMTPGQVLEPSERIDIYALIQRLHYNGKTHVSKLRQREPAYRFTARPRSSLT